MWRRTSIAGVLALSILLSGCVPGPFRDPVLEKLRGIEGGECFADGTPPGFNVMNEVPCQEQHVWEVLGLLPIPTDFEDADLDDLVTPAGDLVDELLWSGLQECVPLVAEWSGLAEKLDAVGTFRGDPMLWPAFNGQVALFLPPEQAWPTVRRLICAVEWSDVDRAPQPVASETADPLIRRFTSDSMPPEQRVCVGPGPEAYLDLDCSGPHAAEVVFLFDAAALVGAKAADALDVSAMGKKDWLPFDEACWSAERAVFGARRSDDDVILMADIAMDAWEVGPFGPRDRPVMCVAVPTDGSLLLDGPVWGLRNDPAPLVAG